MLSDGRAEIDVPCKKRGAVTVLQSKDIKRVKAVARAEVAEWFTKKVPRIRNFLFSKHDLAGRDLAFAMWTTVAFEPEAIDYLEERKAATKKYAVAWKDRAALMEWLSKKKLKQIKDMIEHHY